MGKQTDNTRNSKGQFTAGNSEGVKWKKGDPSPNPNGRRNSFTDILNDLGDVEVENKPRREKIMTKLYTLAERGDLNAIKFIVEKLEGKNLERVQVQDLEPLKILDLPDDFE
jgi:hypothetical protein